MRFDGHWLACDDGIIRPIFRGEILAGDGQWHDFELLVDTGADRTILCGSLLAALRLSTGSGDRQVGGIGGVVNVVTVDGQIRLTRSDGVKATFRSQFVALAEQEALDMSVLGRDILDMFALIADCPGNVLALVSGNHTYQIEQR